MAEQIGTVTVGAEVEFEVPTLPPMLSFSIEETSEKIGELIEELQARLEFVRNLEVARELKAADRAARDSE